MGCVNGEVYGKPYDSTCDNWMGELIKLIIWDLMCAQDETLFFSYFILSYLMGATKG